MARKRYSAEQIIRKLREAEIATVPNETQETVVVASLGSLGRHRSKVRAVSRSAPVRRGDNA